MATYSAVMMHGNRDAEGRYRFEAADDLFTKTPFRIMQAFTDAVEERFDIGHIDYEVNAAMKNADAGIVTVIGEFHFEGDGNQPFMCMISK